MYESVRKRKSWLRRFSFDRYDMTKDSTRGYGLLPEVYFRERLIQERKRAERSNKPLLLMILDPRNIFKEIDTKKNTDSLGEGLNNCVRATDICGLLRKGTLIGVILTEVEAEKVDTAKRTVAAKTRERLARFLTGDVVNRIAISFRIYPGLPESATFDMAFYPELTPATGRKLGGEVLKRSLDIVGSIVGLAIFSPFFLVLPAIIKLNSNGPVLFRQERMGRNGKKFNVLKFRTMYLDNDDVIHREYIQKLIKGTLPSTGERQVVFKIQGDPRVTSVGKYLRKFSLDELPQFINVLKGEMSLVGPRPPIPYEVQHYCGWQRNRLVGKRPGITGLWQVTGRSSTSFDDMVRLDLRYLNKWTILLDVKILLRTPLAVLRCKGAY